MALQDEQDQDELIEGEAERPEDLEFDPVATSVEQVFVEPKPGSEEATGTFEAIVLEGEAPEEALAEDAEADEEVALEEAEQEEREEEEEEEEKRKRTKRSKKKNRKTKKRKQIKRLRRQPIPIASSRRSCRALRKRSKLRINARLRKIFHPFPQASRPAWRKH